MIAKSSSRKRTFFFIFRRGKHICYMTLWRFKRGTWRAHNNGDGWQLSASNLHYEWGTIDSYFNDHTNLVKFRYWRTFITSFFLLVCSFRTMFSQVVVALVMIVTIECPDCQFPHVKLTQSAPAVMISSRSLCHFLSADSIFFSLLFLSLFPCLLFLMLLLMLRLGMILALYLCITTDQYTHRRYHL